MDRSDVDDVDLVLKIAFVADPVAHGTPLAWGDQGFVYKLFLVRLGMCLIRLPLINMIAEPYGAPYDWSLYQAWGTNFDLSDVFYSVLSKARWVLTFKDIL